MSRLLVVLVTALAVVAGVSWAVAGGPSPKPVGPRLVLDDRTGALGVLRLGRDGARVRRVLGPGRSAGRGSGPLRPRFEHASGPPSRPGDWTERRYAWVAVEFDHLDRVTGYVTTSRRAVTSAGVGVGDRLAAVRRAYPTARCGPVTYGESEVEVPHCVVQLRGRQAWIWFGEDPVETLTVWPSRS